MSAAAVCKNIIPKYLISYSRLGLYLDHRKCFCQTSKLCSFYERSKTGGKYRPVFPDDKPWKEILKDSWQEFVKEFKLLMVEIKDKIQQDRKLYKDGDTDVFWRFDSEKCLKQWRIGSDKANKDGFSECSLIINDKKKAVFSGNIDLTPPKDGKKKYAGYCAIKSLTKKKSFFRDDYYDLYAFTHVELRVRGDGRTYSVNLSLNMYFDVNWFDTYTYALFTHGGPYWQVVRIPFSKFFLQSKGCIQDKQCPFPLHKVNGIGIMCAGVAGPFRLEIDYIGFHADYRHTEKFAYELYEIPKYYVST